MALRFGALGQRTERGNSDRLAEGGDDDCS